ncbi:hypothetical protein KEF85_05645 [Methylomonas paludis]|uniref:Uncharacterized protein n=1 Tax=Methylomonas paludis TaxID=1173101 RepID=A0A975MQ41_9GAMM|nr:hypothetical protein [Methylomonas paludis]QWF71941.1 hypothetical protein KEF85_05645 [Methylomonas paludis]
MPKKFKQDCAPPSAKPAIKVSLLEYLQDSAPDILLPLPIMAEVSALRFWQETFQPLRPGEARYLQAGGWRWPYAERLVYLAREFIKLDERSRRYVLKAAAAQIWWRGDDMQRFQNIVQAHLRYRSLNPEQRLEYRRRLMQAAKGLGRGQLH